mmetsp:Transcript_12499/g.18709  ORF Transcript_12499/g.18709 Transcript_12499/m.18709 type:complete len:452 (+) Transcript_12499:48-1403(+)
MSLKYLEGFGNEHQSEALKGAVPNQNNPQRAPYGLVAEQLSGSAFTRPRVHNLRTWFYRIQPAASHPKFEKYEKKTKVTALFDGGKDYSSPERFRWMERSPPKEKVDFVESLVTVAGSGSAASKSGFAVHTYCFNEDMYEWEGKGKRRAFNNADGTFLVVPQTGNLLVITEFGHIEVEPKEIFVIPRGCKFSVNLTKGDFGRGYIAEIFSGNFELPNLGPIGANGLAQARDFLYPTAKYEDDEKANVEHIHKFLGHYSTFTSQTPYDVVGWFGNYAPYKYDCRKFVAVNSVTIDHMDPSIFTVLTVPSNEPGTAVLDFVIFPPRYGVQKNTFRPPYYHRNTMSEYMGLVSGTYEAKLKALEAKKGGFVPGGASLHNCMTGHGPDTKVYEKESTKKLEPEEITPGSLAFMFESMYPFQVTKFASEHDLDEDYVDAWSPFPRKFDATNINGKW